METLECIRKRHSCRKFSSLAVDREKIDRIVEAGLRAPSAMNGQKAHIAVITNKEKIASLSKLNAKIMGREGTDPFYGAPVVMLVYCEAGPTAVYDGSVCLENLLLAATSLGLGSIWIHRAKEEFESAEGKELLKQMGIQGDYVGIGHACIGYVDLEPSHKEIKPGRVLYID